MPNGIEHNGVPFLLAFPCTNESEKEKVSRPVKSCTLVRIFVASHTCVLSLNVVQSFKPRQHAQDVRTRIHDAVTRQKLALERSRATPLWRQHRKPATCDCQEAVMPCIFAKGTFFAQNRFKIPSACSNDAHTK